MEENTFNFTKLIKHKIARGRTLMRSMIWSYNMH